MEKFAEMILGWQTLLISFSTFVVLSTIKRLGTKIDQDDEKKVTGGFAHTKTWKMLQPIFPYPISLGLCFIPGVPLPELAGTSLATKIMFAVVAGWLADKSFQVVKNIMEKAGIKFPEKGE